VFQLPGTSRFRPLKLCNKETPGLKTESTELGIDFFVYKHLLSSSRTSFPRSLAPSLPRSLAPSQTKAPKQNLFNFPKMRFLLIAFAAIVTTDAGLIDGGITKCDFAGDCDAQMVGEHWCCDGALFECHTNLTVTTSSCPSGQTCQSTSKDGSSGSCM
jgi:hypothetical protein